MTRTLIAISVALVITTAVNAQNTTINLPDNGRFQIRCDNGVLSQPSHTGTVWSMVCNKGSGEKPPTPEPTPPPSQGCGQPDKRAQPLKFGQEPESVEMRGLTLSMAPVSRYFCSDDYKNGTYISWGPKAGTRFTALTIIVSTTPLDTDFLSARNKGCGHAASNGGMTVSSNSGCRIKPGTMYYLSMAAKHPTTGKGTCTGRCELILFNAKK